VKAIVAEIKNDKDFKKLLH